MLKKITLTALTAVLLAGAAVATANFVNTPIATAQTSKAKAIVDQAKTAGIIGETATGYLAAVNSAPTNIINAMNEINIGRKSAYTSIARKNNEPVEVAAAVIGEKLIARAPAGQKIMGSNGVWITK